MSAAAETITYTVPEGVIKTRADKLLADFFTEWSRGQLQKVFDEGGVRVAGQSIKKNTKLSAGDRVEMHPPKMQPTALIPVDIPLDILFEDEHIVCVNKFSGMVTHPGNATGNETLVHALLHHTGGALSLAGGEERPGVVHRLDKDTSGVIVFAKSDAAYVRLVEIFSKRRALKEYLALSVGSPELQSGSIKKPIDRNRLNRTKMCVSEEGKFAHTDWCVQERFGRDYTLFQCRIHTGRTHQIRVHLSDMGHSIVGDVTYGYRPPVCDRVAPTRVFLHALHLQLEHPIVDGQILDFKAALPPEYAHALDRLRVHFSNDAKA